MNSVPKQDRRILLATVLAFLVLTGYSQDARTQESGKEIFETTCFACHTIGGGRLVGPDLAGVHKNRTQAWLENFVKSSQSMIDDGDAQAVALFEEFNRMPMPDSLISDEQVRQVLSYIEEQSSTETDSTSPGATSDVTLAEAASQEPASDEDIYTGQELFQGNIRFANNGPACNACHEVRNDAVIGGGVLATELTSVFSRMGEAGVKAILGRAPFPVMQVAYENHTLTEQEVAALVAFLEYADSEQYNQLPRDYGLGLFLSGVVGAGFLFGLFGFVWRGRKRGSVYEEIYDRQIASVSDKED